MHCGPASKERGELVTLAKLDDLHRASVENRPMRAVVQRVSRAEVRVDGKTVGSVGGGLLVLLGAAAGDDDSTAERLATKVARLRIFPDDTGRFDRSLLDTGGEALVVSQFTLLADTGKGNRPSFTEAAPPDVAAQLVDRFVESLRNHGIRVETGVFGARMEVELVNDGPVTIVVEA
jgi:D-tyrosyl-tRNA(Tyr) deacylase